MTSAEDLLQALNCTIHFSTPEGEYEGVLKRVFISSRMITVSKIFLLPSKKKLGTLNFMFHEVSNVKIINRPDIPCENEAETSLLYFLSDIEGMFDLDSDSEIECDCSTDEVPNEGEFVMKLLPCFSKWISVNSQVIDSLNNEFNFAIKLISSEDLIGVSLEGPKISRNGILTWLCISTASCTYLFDILALGKKSFQSGLKFILENSKIKKIFHDCRLASDCLFHMYNVRLVNVFDTQVADSLVMMQESKNCSVITKVNSLDACLIYYLQLPNDYLYSPLIFSLDKKSSHYHGLRPLKHSFRGAMIKNVIYLQLLKRELETALLAPLRRATDVYLNVVQNATNCELMIAPPVMEELPPELLLEGIQIVRYQQHEYIPPVVSSGPPHRKLVNPVKDFVEYSRKFWKKCQNKCVPFKDVAISKNANVNKFSFATISDEICKKSSHFSKQFSNEEYICCQKNTDNIFTMNEFNNIQNSVSFSQNNTASLKESIMNKMVQDDFVSKKTVVNETFVSGDTQVNQNCENEEKLIDPFAKVEIQSNKQITGNTYVAGHKGLSNSKPLKKGNNDVEKISFTSQNSPLLENKYKKSNSVSNCLLRTFNKTSHEKDLESKKSSCSELFSNNSTMFLDPEKQLNILPVFNADCENFWDEIRNECTFKQSNRDQNEHTSKIRFIPAGMDIF
ncbi:piRNA biogenesis protein EXD1 like protein [Argiope bruennichi]|uniref:PiRNA biogenesis protein EXD1 like protein n=1 Tax=Argiope bruennichi TaxID=94029 RepID=A0A8T0FC16_ARGBR|nr:piRNA biogenesis protein EXD1 like protein [Argiope bruennichi]